MLGLGIAVVVAESINGLFLRNCVNFGLPAFSCLGVSALYQEGDMAIIDYPESAVKNERSNESLSGRKLPPSLIQLTLSGGVIPLLRREGYLKE